MKWLYPIKPYERMSREELGGVLDRTHLPGAWITYEPPDRVYSLPPIQPPARLTECKNCGGPTNPGRCDYCGGAP